MLASSAAGPARAVWPTATWQTATPASRGMDAGLLDQARAYALTAGGSGMIIRSGYLVLSWGSTSTAYETKSTTKSIGSMLLGLAVSDGLVDLDDPMRQHLPAAGNPPASNESTGWLHDVTLRQLGQHTSGFEEPGGFEIIRWAPGTTWYYSNCGTNWLADVLTVRFGQDLDAVIRARVLNVIGIPSSHFTWRANAYRGPTIQGIARREFGSGVSASADALARIGYLYLRGGEWNGTTVLPAAFTALVGQHDPSIDALPNMAPVQFPDATSHYGLLWWTNADAAMPAVPTDTYFAWGLLDNLIVVMPSLDIVAVRAGGGGWQPTFTSNYAIVEPFIAPIALSVAPGTAVGEHMDVRSWSRIKAEYRR